MAERHRRIDKKICPDVDLESTETSPVNQETFFCNETNKKRFINKLIFQLEAANFKTDQAYEDADTLIVNKASDISNSSTSTIIVAEDIDVLVIYTQLISAKQNIYFLKPSKGSRAEEYFDTESFLAKFDLEPFINSSLKKLVAFIHAFTGCDTTSAFNYKGKHKLIKILSSNEDLMNEAAIYNKKNASPQQIKSTGCKIISAMYSVGNKCDFALNTLRYLCFKRGCTKKTFNISMIPPTESAAEQHCFRVYFQVQQWLGNELDPKKWGWEVVNNMLLPTTSKQKLIPDNLLKNISCKCLKKCSKLCSCVKHGLKCSEFCSNCQGVNCSNSMMIKEDVEIDLDLDYEENDSEEILESEKLIYLQDDDYDMSDDENVESEDEEPINASKKRKIR